MENSNTLPKIEVPLRIWANIYNPIKPNSWDLYHTESSAVQNSIGAKTHCYLHESIAQVIKPTKERGYTEQEMFDFANSYADNVMGGMLKTPSEYFSEYIESLNK